MAYMFRIVGPRGQGLYTGAVNGNLEERLESPWEMCCSDALDEDRHPMPSMDTRLVDGLYEKGMPLYGWCRDWVFGFANIVQLRSWIYRGSWRKALGAYGCKLVVLEAPAYDFIPGDTQAMMRYGVQVASVPLEEVWAYYDNDTFLAERLDLENGDEWIPE